MQKKLYFDSLIPRARSVWVLVVTFFYVIILSPHTMAEEKVSFKPAMFYEAGTDEGERSFIDMVIQGARKAEKELDVSVAEFRMPNKADITAFISDLAAKGYSPLIAVGHQNVVPVLNLAQTYPEVQFNVIDGLVPPIYPNVQSIIFKDHEGAFLVGMVAAYTSKTNHIGFIGGREVPLIKNFGYGFTQGARFVRPNIKIDTAYVGNTPEAWGQPDVAYTLAEEMYKNECDVIFAAAGGSSIGVLRAANDMDTLAIGVDTNQNGVFPGHILTSLVKRADVVVYNVLKTSHDKTWRAGIKSLGLKESALDFSVDEYNRHLVTDSIVEQVLITRERIINGLIDVESYSAN